MRFLWLQKNPLTMLPARSWEWARPADCLRSCLARLRSSAIAVIQKFDTEDEAVSRPNDTEFGLAGYVFTENLDRALNVADRLRTVLVGINQGVPSNAAAPFGGVKQSGMGREGGGEGLDEYQEVRFYNIARRATA
jgi:succinate-semialdehyde dehydrogenase / glutarate-semialdehyde dehydrogenase